MFRLRDRWMEPHAIRLLALLVVTVASTPLLATKIRPVNLEEMVARANRIFSGRCVDVRTDVDAHRGLPIIVATFEVERRLKGAVGQIVTLRQIGPFDATGISARSTYRVGQRVVLFLYGESAAGFTSPVGLIQGKFDVHLDKHGQEVVVNPQGNLRLLDGLSPDARQRLGETWEGFDSPGRLSSDALLDAVEKLQH